MSDKKPLIREVYQQQLAMGGLNDRNRKDVVHTYTPSTIEEAADTTTTSNPRTGEIEVVSRPIREGSLAETGVRDPSGYNPDPQWWIRINGRWVSLLGACSAEDTAQPIYGTEPFAGIAPCAAKLDHVHGIPDSFDNPDGTIYPEGTVMFVNNKGWVRVNDMIYSFTHLHVPYRILDGTSTERVSI